MIHKRVLIVSGEPSGDLHASNLVNNLKALNPGIGFFGMGGSLSKAAGVDIVFDITELALIGYIEVVKNIIVVGKAYKSILARMDLERPDLAILVDYPGFNLRLANELKKRSVPIVYYISPQVWAWGRDRVSIIKRCVKKIIVFFKFEEELYKTYGVDAEFVGHPLLDTVKTTLPKNEVLKRYALAEGKTTIALLPGSRKNEVKAILPVMAKAAKIIKDVLGTAQFIVSKHPAIPIELYEEAVKDAGQEFKFAEGDTYNIVGAADFAIVTSGTATLETGIIGTPLLITYKTSLITYLAYLFVRSIGFVGLVNIVANKEVAPELLQFDANPEKIAAKVVEIVSSAGKMAAMREELGRVKDSLGSPGASLRAARSILRLLN